MTATQKEIAPLPLPIREAIDLDVTGTEGNGRKTIFADLPNVLRKALRQDSICLAVNLPGSKACIPYKHSIGKNTLHSDKKLKLLFGLWNFLNFQRFVLGKDFIIKKFDMNKDNYVNN